MTLNRNQLKYLAAASMLLDHIAWVFVPARSVQGELMHFFGRFAAPTMLFFLTEGYIHTHNNRRYAGRLALFALLSWIPFSLFETGRWPTMHFGMIWTLFLGLAALWFWDRENLGLMEKCVAVLCLCALSLMGDWSVLGIILPLVFFHYRDRERDKWRMYAIVCLCFTGMAMLLSGPVQVFQLGMLPVPLLLKRYNGENGSRAPFHKWFFYCFYPVHLLLLFLVGR